MKKLLVVFGFLAVITVAFGAVIKGNLTVTGSITAGSEKTTSETIIVAQASNAGAGSKPAIRWAAARQCWQYTNNGSTWYDWQPADMLKANYATRSETIVNAACETNDETGNVSTAAQVKTAVDNSHTAATWGTKTIDETGIDSGVMAIYSTDDGGKWIVVQKSTLGLGGGTGTDQDAVINLIWAFQFVSLTPLRRRRMTFKKLKQIGAGIILSVLVASMALAAIANVHLARASLLSTNTTIYTATGATHIKLLVMHNLAATAETVSLYLIPSGGSEDLRYRVYCMAISGNNTVQIPYEGPGLVMANGGVLSGRTTTDSQINIWVEGATE